MEYFDISPPGIDGTTYDNYGLNVLFRRHTKNTIAVSRDLIELIDCFHEPVYYYWLECSFFVDINYYIDKLSSLTQLREVYVSNVNNAHLITILNNISKSGAQLQKLYVYVRSTFVIQNLIDFLSTQRSLHTFVLSTDHLEIKTNLLISSFSNLTNLCFNNCCLKRKFVGCISDYISNNKRTLKDVAYLII